MQKIIESLGFIYPAVIINFKLSAKITFTYYKMKYSVHHIVYLHNTHTMIWIAKIDGFQMITVLFVILSYSLDRSIPKQQ